jgi:hypothetical protein
MRRKSGATEAIKNDDNWQMIGNFDAEYKDDVVADIRALAALKPNWDHYGAPTINARVIDAAERFVRSLPDEIDARPRVVPMSTGTLQLEWYDGEKILELEFEAPYRIRFLQWDPKNDYSDEDTFHVSDTDKAALLIHWVTSYN